jgi:hypothetical protein
MHHKIKDAAALPMVWNDDESIWEIDFEEIRGPLSQAETAGYQAPVCPCADGADAAAEVEHDEVWGRAVATPFPTADDVAHMLGFSMVKAKRMAVEDTAHPRSISPELRVDLERRIKDAFYNTRNDGGTMDQAAHRAMEAIISTIASVDENAHRRGEAAARSGVRA